MFNNSTSKSIIRGTKENGALEDVLITDKNELCSNTLASNNRRSAHYDASITANIYSIFIQLNGNTSINLDT